MWTAAIVSIFGVCWLIANSTYQARPNWKARRLRSSFAWAMVGAMAGSYFGVAGFGTAVGGAIPGAIAAYILVGYVMKVDRPDTVAPVVQQAPSAIPLVDEYYRRTVKSAVQGVRSGALRISQAECADFARLEDAWAFVKTGTTVGGVPDDLVVEFERLQVWWWGTRNVDGDAAHRTTYILLVNTARQVVNGIIMRFTDEGWTTNKASSATFHVMRLAKDVKPGERVVIKARLPENASWYVADRGARGDIVGAFASWPANAATS
jgi:hypothetical protein